VYGAMEIEKNTFKDEIVESVSGRIMSIRAAGAKLIFIDLHGDESKVQVMATANNYQGNFEFLHEASERRYCWSNRKPRQIQDWRISIRPTKIDLLSYCFHMLPTEHDIQAHGL